MAYFNLSLGVSIGIPDSRGDVFRDEARGS